VLKKFSADHRPGTQRQRTQFLQGLFWAEFWRRWGLGRRWSRIITRRLRS